MRSRGVVRDGFTVIGKDTTMLDGDSTMTISGERARPHLETHIDADLLRGCSIKDMLSNFGNAFASGTGYLEVEASDYNLSRVVQKLNDFISHSWTSPRWTKFFAICLVYNGTAALVASYVAGCVIALFQFDSIAMLPKPIPRQVLWIAGHEFTLTRGVWCSHIGPIIFVMFFLFWQRLRDAFQAPQKFAFLDRLCVDQVNEENKQAAILGLGGFLHHSDRMIVCWTPRYFTRLWCVYEVATWLHLGKPLESVMFVPLEMVLAMLIAFLFMWCLAILQTWGEASARLSIQSIPRVGTFTGFTILQVATLVLLLHKLRHYVYTLQQLPEQIKRFSLEDVTCFCCANQHRMPDTGAPIRCDRQLVFRTIATWFANSVDQTDDKAPLVAFEQSVRDQFGEWVLQRVGPGRWPYRWTAIVCLPEFFRLCDHLAGAESFPSFLVFMRFLCHEAVHTCFIIPLFIIIAFRLCLFFNSVCGMPARMACNLLLSLLVSVSWLTTMVITQLPARLLKTFPNAVPILVLDAIWSTIAVAAFRGSCWRSCLRGVRLEGAEAIGTRTTSEVINDPGMTAAEDLSQVRYDKPECIMSI